MAHTDAEIIERLLDVLQLDILPTTQAAIEAGNKIFGAAVVDRHSLELVITGTNEETENPLLHGEVACLNRFWALDKTDRPDPRDCLFLSTHEPCSLCLSAITWSGFDNFYYLFSYEDSRDAFNIPHDLRILEEVFGVEEGAYRSRNAYWSSYSLTDIIQQQSNNAGHTKWCERVEALRQAYAVESSKYQAGKGDVDIPLD